MEINSKYFSLIEYSESAVLHFPNGLFGFEDSKSYIIIQFDENNDNLYCLQSIDNETLAFILIKIGNYISDYPQVVKDSLKDIPFSLESLSVLTMCTVQDSIADSTTNLKCPIVIDLDSNIGSQIILENEEYVFKYPFSSLSEKEGLNKC